ncbi:MAG: polysaccharide biosynthesis/export family protein [Acidobacteria bacterium]|nr:polysaccharide biosynthesis/export family protein [Acidobacteriota bacterium]
MSDLATLALRAAATLALLLSAACAPGMKLNLSPSKPQEDYRIQGQHVTLRPLSPQVVQAFGNPALNTSGVDELLAVKATPYLIGPQDVLQVTVWEHPELTIPLGQYRTDAATGQLVDEEGNMFFPYAGILNVQGQTAMQVRAKLVDRLSRVLKSPQVDVKVIVFRSQKVFVGGEVRQPGVQYISDAPLTLAESLGRAGGFLPAGDDSRVQLTRGNRSWVINYYGLMQKGSRYGQILLKDGDHLTVQAREDEPVYMLGEVSKPSIVPLRHGRLSLAQALAEAGGMERLSSNAHSVYVLRRGATDGSVDLFHLDAKNPTAMVLADRFNLNPRDMVYVDAGALVRWSRVVTMLLPTFTSLSQTAADAKYLR